jgi:molecular chaperone Hsp33
VGEAENNPRDALVRTVSADGGLAVRALVGTALVQEAARRHETAPTATAALGRTLMGAVLLGSGAKDDETTQIQVRGSGALGTVTAISDGLGRARGYVQWPRTHLPPREGKLDVGGAVGAGVLAVVRYHPSWREPYSGLVPLVSGEIAEDLASYLLESEQIPSALALGVHVRSEGTVSAAGGYLVQALPGADPEVLERLAARVHELPTVSSMLLAGVDADGLLDRLLGDLAGATRTRSEPRFSCLCTRERVQRAVLLLGREEAEAALAEQGEIEVVCEFCVERYTLGPDEVRSLFV